MKSEEPCLIYAISILKFQTSNTFLLSTCLLLYYILLFRDYKRNVKQDPPTVRELDSNRTAEPEQVTTHGKLENPIVWKYQQEGVRDGLTGTKVSKK